jgi:dihydrofolate synthase/folylpolyglutamate synthase
VNTSSLQQVLNIIREKHPIKIDLSLNRVQLLLDKLGQPNLKLPPTIHVAGTNGKGSTIAFLSACFAELGLQYHRYTSPHLVRFNERIYLNNQEITDDVLIPALQSTIELCEQHHLEITYFEAITATAFVLFSQYKNADILLLETGLGGKLDATNVVPKKVASIITSIDFDHQDYLGDTLHSIAEQKAGIINSNSPTIIAQQKHQSVSDYLVAICRGKQGQSFCYGYDWFYDMATNTLTLPDNTKFNLPKPSLFGSYQYENASTALVAMWLYLQQRCNDAEQLRQQLIRASNGITKAVWPARMQFLKVAGKKFIIDGSHNIAGASTVLELLQSFIDDDKVSLVTAQKPDKSIEFYDVFLSNEEIKRKITNIYTLPISGLLELQQAEDLAIKLETRYNIPARSYKSIDALLPHLTTDHVVVTGSLYLAGEVLQKIGDIIGLDI